MRSRFTAFAMGDIDYVLSSWHPSTRPQPFALDEGIRWYRLDILDRVGGGPLDEKGIVEFEAFYAGSAVGSQRERSSFVRDGGRWYYLSEEP